MNGHKPITLDSIHLGPEYFLVQESPSGRTMGYIMGKSEGKQELWHGHVTAVTVAPEFRRLGLAKHLMTHLEDISEKMYNAYFVDLFVRVSNALAINMYRKFGYEVYRQVIEYYSGEEDAYGTWMVWTDRRVGRFTPHAFCHRYAESTAARPVEKVDDPASKPGPARGPGVVTAADPRNVSQAGFTSEPPCAGRLPQGLTDRLTCAALAALPAFSGVLEYSARSSERSSLTLLATGACPAPMARPWARRQHGGFCCRVKYLNVSFIVFIYA